MMHRLLFFCVFAYVSLAFAGKTAKSFPRYSTDELKRIAQNCDWQLQYSDWGQIFQCHASVDKYTIHLRLIPLKKEWEAGDPINHFATHLRFKVSDTYYWGSEPNDHFNGEDEWLVRMLYNKGLFAQLEQPEKARYTVWLNSKAK